MLGRKAGIAALACFATMGCASYQYAKNVKMMSYDGNVTPGVGVGPVRGESCQSWVMGYPISEAATLDKAMAAAREKNQLRYLNNVSTENGGFDAYFFRKYCLIAKGTGYK